MKITDETTLGPLFFSDDFLQKGHGFFMLENSTAENDFL